MAQGLPGGTLSFTNDRCCSVSAADLVWVNSIRRWTTTMLLMSAMCSTAVRWHISISERRCGVLISSQVPVGRRARLEHDFRRAQKGERFRFAYSPENLRLGDAIRVFTQPERIVIGVRSDRRAQGDRTGAQAVLPDAAVDAGRIRGNGKARAEFLSRDLRYLHNEIASMCESVAADMSEVEAALRLDPRIGRRPMFEPARPSAAARWRATCNFSSPSPKTAASVFPCSQQCWKATTITSGG